MKLILAATALSLATITSALGQSLPEATRALCATEWPTDYRMQKYCIDQQAEAYIAWSVYEAAEEGSLRDLVERCREEWGDDVKMGMYCINQQMDAVTELQELMATADNHPARRKAVTGCIKEWGKDYRMQSYCVKNQFEAIEELGL